MKIHPLTPEGMDKSKAKLAALREADQIRRDTSQAKNDLESYVLKVKYPWLASEGHLWLAHIYVSTVKRERGELASRRAQ